MAVLGPSNISAELSTIKVAPIKDRIGQQLRNLLLDRINPTGSPRKPKYNLTVQISESKQELAIKKTDISTRANLTFTAKFQLQGLEQFAGRMLTGEGQNSHKLQYFKLEFWHPRHRTKCPPAGRARIEQRYNKPHRLVFANTELTKIETMKITARNADAFSKSPTAEMRVVLVHGRDSGLIRERVRNLALSIVPDLQDPFQVSELTGPAIKSDPACLADEAAAQSLTGGRRVVLVRLGAEDISTALKQVLEMANIDALVVLEAADLAATSPVRKLLENHEHGASLACYEDGRATLASLVSEMSRAAGIEFSRDASDYIFEHLGSDRLVSRREIEKLIVYAGAKSEVSLEDAMAVIGDNGALSIEEIIYAVGSGNRQALETGLHRATAEGISPVVLVRAAQRHFQRLHFAVAACGQGKTTRGHKKLKAARAFHV